MRRGAAGGGDSFVVVSDFPNELTRVTLRRPGTLSYAEGLALQRRLIGRMQQDPLCSEQLILLEHTPVVTIGRSARKNNLRAGVDVFRRERIQVYPTNRGGDITYHGPGQLVAYPLLRLTERDLFARSYMRALEQLVIETLATYNIVGERDERYTGVWTGGRKICAVGIALTGKRISWHGFALNVTTDLDHFKLIVPCGIPDAAVTSLKVALAGAPPMEEVMERIERSFEKVFQCRLERSISQPAQAPAP